MRLSLGYPNSLTGSEPVAGLFLYLSKTKFTVDNLPPPYYNNISQSTGLNVVLPELDVPTWVKLGFRGADNQIAYGPIMCGIELSPNYSAALGTPLFLSGDPYNGRYKTSISSTNTVSTGKFDEGTSYDSEWSYPNVAPMIFKVEGSWIGASILIDNLQTTARIMYDHRYMAKEGDLSDTWPEALFGSIGPPLPQGRTWSGPQITWRAWVPTLEEFRKYLGAIYLSAIPSDIPPLSIVTRSTNELFLTSTPWPDDENMLTAINPTTNTTHGIYPFENIAVQLLFDFIEV